MLQVDSTPQKRISFRKRITMEVHHSHHPTHKKKWTEYLLEFLMLFLAVFLGFLVENYREHKVELERTEKHMHTMVENLKYDTTRYGGNLRSNLNSCKGLDSFRNEIFQAINGKINANRLYYYYWKYGRASASATLNATAMTQLKSSGMLRMIKEDSLVNHIGDYYERIYNIHEYGVNVLTKKRDQTDEIYGKIFSYMGFEQIIERDTIMVIGGSKFTQNFTFNLLNRNPPLELKLADQATFKQLYDAVAAWELSLHAYDGRLRYCQKGAEDLMKHIKEEYDFGN